LAIEGIENVDEENEKFVNPKKLVNRNGKFTEAKTPNRHKEKPTDCLPKTRKKPKSATLNYAFKDFDKSFPTRAI